MCRKCSHVGGKNIAKFQWLTAYKPVCTAKVCTTHHQETNLNGQKFLTSNRRKERPSNWLCRWCSRTLQGLPVTGRVLGTFRRHKLLIKIIDSGTRGNGRTFGQSFLEKRSAGEFTWDQISQDVQASGATRLFFILAETDHKIASPLELTTHWTELSKVVHFDYLLMGER